MWITKKKYEKLETELRNEIDRRVKWAEADLNDLKYAAKEGVYWEFKNAQKRQIKQAALQFLYELIETPPHGFIEALIKKINNVQLEK